MLRLAKFQILVLCFVLPKNECRLQLSKLVTVTKFSSVILGDLLQNSAPKLLEFLIRSNPLWHKHITLVFDSLDFFNCNHLIYISKQLFLVKNNSFLFNQTVVTNSSQISNFRLCSSFLVFILICRDWTTQIVLPLKEKILESSSDLSARFYDIHPSLLLFLHRLKCIAIDDKVK